MEQTRALNALEPYLALSKSANSPRAAADLITQATSAPNTFVFAELLQAPTIQALSTSPEYSSHLRLLEIFAWGTWEDYTAAKSELPSLSPVQTTKLKLLSLLPLSAKPSQLDYVHLSKTLDIPTTRALEDLLITAIYSNLITATLNPAASQVSITSVAPLRDLRPGSVPGLIDKLTEWGTRCDNTLADLQREIEIVKKNAAKRESRRAREELLKARVEASLDEKAGKRGAGTAPDDDAMDVDVTAEADKAQSRTRSAKRGAYSGMGR